MLKCIFYRLAHWNASRNTHLKETLSALLIQLLTMKMTSVAQMKVLQMMVSLRHYILYTV